jgi:hypothetical protein
MKNKKQVSFHDRFNRMYTIKSKLLRDAKKYIEANCHRVTDWSRLYLEVKNGNNINNENKLESFHYAPKDDGTMWRIAKRLGVEDLVPEREFKDDSVKTVTDPVYDTSDGDFSITINGLQWWWINDEAVMSIALYVERALRI